MKTGVPSETGDAAVTGAVFRLAGCVTATVGLRLAPGDGAIVGNRPDALPAPMNTLASPFRAGMGPSGSTAMWLTSGEAAAELFVEAAAAVTAVVSAAAGGVHFVVVTTLAVAVSFTELTEVAFDATAICAFRLVAFVVTELRPHEAVPSSLAHPLLNVGFWLDGCAVSATDTSEADPFSVQTWTTYPAVWPVLMLDCERWTLTHSSGGAVVPVLPLPLPLVTGLGSELGLVATSSSSVPAAVGVAVPVAVGVAVPVALAVAVPDGDAEGDGEVVVVGPPLARTGGGPTLGVELGAAELFVDGLLELVEGDGDGDAEGDKEGDTDGEGDGDGDGEGVGVPEAGSAWHTESVLAAVARGAACALPSMPRVRKPPLSTVSAAALACPKCIRIACLRCSSGLPCALRDSEATRGPDGYEYSFPLTGYLCITFLPDRRPRRRRPAARGLCLPASPTI